MVLMCRRLLPEAERRDIYLQGAARFKLPTAHSTVKVCCSAHNPGARELADELNGIWPGLLQVADVESLSSCDHMIVYLNAVTWTFAPELLATEIRQAKRIGLHLQLCHEFVSALDPGSARQALEFKQVMDTTPADLRRWPTNLYSQIAIALKGGELRGPGLANLAARLAVRVPRQPVAVESASRHRSFVLRRGSRPASQQASAQTSMPGLQEERGPRQEELLRGRLWPQSNVEAAGAPSVQHSAIVSVQSCKSSKMCD